MRVLALGEPQRGETGKAFVPVLLGAFEGLTCAGEVATAEFDRAELVPGAPDVTEVPTLEVAHHPVELRSRPRTSRRAGG